MKLTKELRNAIMLLSDTCFDYPVCEGCPLAVWVEKENDWLCVLNDSAYPINWRELIIKEEQDA